jgi:SAM-dependent methyltransferase
LKHLSSWIPQCATPGLAPSQFFMTPRDIGLFLLSARTDAAIARLRATVGARTAFESVYSRWNDPWASASPLYRDQRRKYEQVVGLLADRRFRRALDLGCGLGLLAQLLAPQVDELLGLDIAGAAIDRARQRAALLPNLHFEQADLLELPRNLDHSFDLVLLVDTLYYLSPIDDESLKQVAMRIADLLVPGGLCVLVNHCFFAMDSDSRISRRIHRAFSWSPRFRLGYERRKPFFLASLLTEQLDLACNSERSSSQSGPALNDGVKSRTE